MKKKLFTAIIFSTLSFFSIAQENIKTGTDPVLFRFKYSKGDSYRILSTVEEDVYVNRIFDHHSVIVNRVSAQVTETNSDGSGTHEMTYMTSENSTGNRTEANFTWGEEYSSIFIRDVLGKFTISDIYFMPQVRDVPVFPEEAIIPGTSWTYEGNEAHDLRQNFGMEKPFKVPFTATYTYLGTVQNDDVNSKDAPDVFHVINVKYTLEFETPNQSTASSPYKQDYPAKMLGYSDETLYWDNEKGSIHHYTENFRIIMTSAYGHVYDFQGTAHAETTELVQTNNQENIDEVQKHIDELQIENVNVLQGDKGLTISIEDIKFKPDSAILLDSEKEKLMQIAEILKKYPDNDILITGHTALAGTAKERQRLSEERAKAVANYLLTLGVKDQYHIFTQGLGATAPIADNSTEEGKARNRRVEITILEK